MQAMYEAAALNRQALWKYKFSQNQAIMEAKKIIESAKKFRKDHPKQGTRQLYWSIKKSATERGILQGWGRDKVEQLLLQNGFRVVLRRNVTKTTHSGGMRFKNLIEGLDIRDINHVWVSDITYFQLVNQHRKVCTYYLTSIMDVYSRMCLGLVCGQTLKTEDTTLPALQMALATRNIAQLDGLILHSDGGGQYCDKAFLKLLAAYHVQSSMARSVYENPFAERLHSTLKNDYLYPNNINSLAQLRQQAGLFLQRYNNQRRHSALGNITPLDFESRLPNIPMDQRITTHIEIIQPLSFP